MSNHIVYAVLDTVGRPKVAVSRPLSWDAAIDRYTDLERWSPRGGSRPLTVGMPRDLIADAPVRFLAVRSADDPNWPAMEAGHRRLRGLARDARTGRFV